VTLLDNVLARRDALLASPSFRRWAASFPVTRRLARRRSREVFDLTAGFVYSQTLLAAVRLGLLDALSERPHTPEELARRLDLTAEATSRLLFAAKALRLVSQRSAGRYGLGALGGPIAGNPAVAALIEHNAILYRDLSDPVALFRGEAAQTELGRYWAYARADRPAAVSAEAVADYSALMALSLPMVAEEVLDAYSLREHRCLLDVGGGEGVFLELAGRRAPSLRLMLFDLPAVAHRAQTRLGAAGLGDRATVHGGSFITDPLPAGADLITLLRVLPDHDDPVAQTILNACRKALAPGGRLLIADPLADLPGADVVGAAYFGLYTLAMGTGRARELAEYRSMLRSAGFSSVSTIRTHVPVQTGLLLATA
jgi:demethylspheroidene O-methyltransferase